jgi:hypothetical protein
MAVIINGDTGVTTPTGVFSDASGNVVVGSGDASATPVGNTLRAPDAAGTDIAGANLNISPGASTGSATGGYVSFSSVVTPGASGATENTFVERMRVYSTGTATDSPAGLHIASSGIYPSAVPITGNGDRLASLMVHGLSEASASLGIVNWGASTSDEPNLNFFSLNGGTVGSFGTVPTSGVNLGNITFEGYSGVGSDMLVGAAIFAESSGTWTSTTSPSLLRLQTAGATGGVATRILIDEDAVSIEANTGFSISETAITTGSSAIGNVFSGVYTPTLTNVTNIAASTAYTSHYMRVGNVVTVSGRLNIDPTAATTASELGISLPIASAFTTLTECGGTGAIYSTSTEVSSGGILADAANDRAAFRFVSGGTAARDYAFTFTYKVI